MVRLVSGGDATSQTRLLGGRRFTREAADEEGPNRRSTKDYTYEGQMVDGKMSGTGTKRLKDGRVYQGAWRDNDLCYGTLTWPSGDKYVGGFVADKQHGEGTLTKASGHSYEGQWMEGVQSGQGMRKWPDGRTYEGSFSND